MSNIPKKLKQYRKKHKISQSEFAKKLHVTKQAVSKWETGKGMPDTTIIPLIAEELGISIDSLMIGGSKNKQRFYRYGFIAFCILIVVLISPFIIGETQKRMDFNEMKNSIEEQTGLDLPNKGELVQSDFSNWIQFGNSVNVERMSFIVFKEYEQTEEFEELLEGDIKWITSINDPLKEQIPLHLHSYTTDGDYYILYNVVNETFNEEFAEPDANKYLFIVYQKENNRFIIFDYTLGVD